MRLLPMKPTIHRGSPSPITTPSAIHQRSCRVANACQHSAALAVAIAALAGRAAELFLNGAVHATADAEEGDATDDATDDGNCWIGPMATYW
jgi:hypothetical protein